ncbi:caspase family protein [Nocardia amikacinitolerans]|uniref:caspase family protein n=1 Tax=Nocardia amikacinitolerans TaxID=756689 RepID=UPI0020A28AAC|nr:caspase family protein [Nocardia amikacinitolerans]MCP2287562.1 Caspase domain-containing protein [Nocardia amikacinitolerans]
MRKALIVGIDYYEKISCLHGCVNDASSVRSALERHADGTINFKVPQVILGTGPGQNVSRSELKASIKALFEDDPEVALFYFAGHGHIEETGGYLCASDCRSGDDGVPLYDVLTYANCSKARNKIIILDSCHSGIAGASPRYPKVAEISEGVTILTASTAEQYAQESNGSGVFTRLFVDALSGAAANLLGDITPGSIYAHIDQCLGSWGQRPVFKTNVKTFISLKKSRAPIELLDLQAITTHFPSPDHEFRLDPSYEPERSIDQLSDPSIPAPDSANTAVFAVLQKYVKVNLVRPIGAPHMWHAAMGSKSCGLTVVGQHYWNLVNDGLI